MPRTSKDLRRKSKQGATVESAPRKTERSHEENQERAYIAASRRGDRSLEARVQSARQASDIHKKRTGKGFRITDEIVMKEEMYEEEDDDMPRSLRLLTAHMQTSSAGTNARLEDFLANRVAFSNALAQANMAWRSNDINRAFANTFPNAHMHIAQPQNVMPPQPQVGIPPQPQVGMPPQSGQQFHQMPNSSVYHHQPPDAFSSMGYPPPLYSPTPVHAPASFSEPYSPSAFSPGMPGPGPYSPGAAPARTFSQGMSSPSFSPGMDARASFSPPFSPQGMPSPMPPMAPTQVMTPDLGTVPLAQSSSVPPPSRKSSDRRRAPSPRERRRRRASQKAASSLNRNLQSPSSAPVSVDTIPSLDTPPDLVDQTPPFGSAFTSELPPEVRMLLGGVGADDVLNRTLANQDMLNQPDDLTQALFNSMMAPSPSSMPRSAQMETAGSNLETADSGLMQDALTNPPTTDCISSNGAVSATPGDDIDLFLFNCWGDQQ